MIPAQLKRYLYLADPVSNSGVGEAFGNGYVPGDVSERANRGVGCPGAEG